MTRLVHPDGNVRFTVSDADVRLAVVEFLEKRNELLTKRWQVRPDVACGTVDVPVVWNAEKPTENSV